MKKFLKHIFLFLLPLGILFAPGIFLLYHTNEFYSIEEVGALSKGEEPLLYAPAYSNFTQELQKQGTLLHQPTVLALGNSRVGEFRGVFFKDPGIFYNATGAVGALSDFKNFLEAVAPYQPKILIVNMDHYFFNPDQAKNNVVTRPNPFTNPQSSWIDVALEALIRQGGWWKVYADYWHDKYSPTEVFSHRTPNTSIGLRAVVDKSGRTNDGSDYYNTSTPSFQPKTMEAIHALADTISPTHGDWYGDSISADALQETRTFLEYCKEKGIFVIGFLPPIAPTEYDRIQAFPDASYAEVVKTLAPTLSTTYREYGFDFYDFSDVASIGGSDLEMIDAKHGGEKMYLRLFLKIAESKPLQPFVDISVLTKKLTSATSTYYVFGLKK